MEIAVLLTTALSPFFFHLLKLGQPMAEAEGKQLGSKLGEGSWETAKTAWAKLSSKVAAKPLMQGAAVALAEDAEDAEAQAIFTKQLEKLFTAAPDLEQTLSVLLSCQPQPKTLAVPPSASSVDPNITGDRNVVTGQVNSWGQVTVEQSSRGIEVDGDAQGIFIAGDNNTIQPSLLPAGDLNPFGVPYPRNRYFAGREGVLLQLHEQLTQTSTVAITQVQAISGLGGIGKTQTAVEYAYRYHYEKTVYETVFWVNADTEVSLSSDFASIAEQVAVAGAQLLKQDDKIRAVRRWLNSHYHWLLIFDNADHPEWLPVWMPPNPRGKVLITSRANVFDSLGIETPIALDVFSETEALRLLFERTGIPRTSESEAEAKALNQALDGLPLALEQSSAYIARQKIGFGHYLRAYRHQGLTQLEKGKAQTGRYPSTVLKTWQLNIAAVSQENPAATALLELSTFLAPDEIPECILTAGGARLGFGLGDYLWSTVGDDKSDAVSLALRELLALLSQYSLVRWMGDPSTYSVHRLVQAVVRDQITAEKSADWLAQITAAIADAHPGWDFSKWPQCQQLLPHWLRIVELGKASSYRSAALGGVGNQAGFFLTEQGRYDEAEPLLQQAVEIRQTELGKHHPSTASSLNNLALLYVSQGRYDEAEPLLQQAVEIRQTELGNRHLDTASSLFNLALLYKAQGRYVEAEPLYKQALEIRQTELGEHHPSTASSLNNLALLYKAQGRYVEAEPLLQQALKILRTELGDRHPSTATSLNNLAGLYKARGCYVEAESLLQQALEIRQTELGECHPNTATGLFNLAVLYHQTQRSNKALSYIQKALAIYIPILGYDHPETQAANCWLQVIEPALAENLNND
ncbi:MAG: tetratricopeptide repeat protein [Cyanobacteria bacterium J06621_11]